MNINRKSTHPEGISTKCSLSNQLLTRRHHLCLNNRYKEKMKRRRKTRGPELSLSFLIFSQGCGCRIQPHSQRTKSCMNQVPCGESIRGYNRALGISMLQTYCHLIPNFYIKCIHLRKPGTMFDNILQLSTNLGTRLEQQNIQ